MSATSGRYFGHSEGNTNIPLRPIYSVAIEIDDNRQFVGARATTADLMHQSYTYDTPAALLGGFVRSQYRGYEMLLYQADYDMRYLIPPLEKLVNDGFACTFTIDPRNRIIFAKIARDNHRWYIRDMSSILPLDPPALRALAGAGDGAPIEQVCLEAYRKMAGTLRDTFAVRPSVTMGTTSVHAWGTTLPAHHIFYRQRPGVDALARDGYFGGMVWLQSQAEREACTHLDVNAMFAHAMRQGVPVMSPTSTDHYYTEHPGIYRCAVYCPPSVPFAFVPLRDDGGIGLSYPRGQLYETVLCSHTIDLARSVGYTIDVIGGYVFERIDYPFATFLDRCQTLENEWRGKGAASVIKSLRNSLYGKFGQRTEGKEYYLTSTPDIDMSYVLTWDGEIIDHLYYRRVPIERSYMQPAWAAWITASARNMLVRAVYALGPRSCYYGDTDSIVISDSTLAAKGHYLDMGDQYGQWKVADHYETFRAMAPKFYTALSSTGEIVTRSAGIKRGAISVDMARSLVPGGEGVVLTYEEINRAINTVGDRPISRATVKHVVVPMLDAPYMLDDGLD